MKIAILGTKYSCLLYFLLENKENTFFILGTSVVLKGIKNENVVKIREDNKIKLKILIVYYIKRIKFLYKIYQMKKKDLKIYATDYMHEVLFFKNYKISLIEDGAANYIEPVIRKFTLKEKIIKKLTLKKYKDNYKPFGYEKNIEKIYLTGLGKIPYEIEKKVEIINLKELWEKKTFKEQEEILEIFDLDRNLEKEIKNRDIILFTQPLSEDNIISEEEKIDLYKKILLKYPQDRVVIKVHPREITNYRKYFKEYLILTNPFPFEILSLIDIKFKKAVTIFSTAALGLGPEVEIDFYGTEIHPELLKKFGSQENLKKTNSFI